MLPMTSNLFETARHDAKTPVFVLTGFFGSGKTTLLNRLLSSPALADTAVIVNELGEIALDHLLVERIEGEVALLRSGCVCCAVRSDFETTLRELLAQRDEGRLPPFARVIIETTGLADPAPLVQAVDTNPLLTHFCHLGAVLTTVDAVNASHQLEHQWEAREQVALADWLIVTKTDLCADTVALDAVLQELNPQAERCRVAPGFDLNALLLTRATHPTLERSVGLLAGRRLGSVHGDGASVAWQAQRPLDWPRLQSWLAALRKSHGDSLLRLKGIVHVVGEADPLLLHGAHHLFHPPLAAPTLDWPAGRSALVLVVRGVDAAMLRAGLDECLA